MMFFQHIFYELIFIIYALNYVNCKFLVTTNNGVINGVEEKTAHTNKVYYAYRGIPFAKPPVGDLRFEPPQPIENWKGILDATKEKDVCVQFLNTIVKTSKIIGNEDCLYLNIYTPVCPNTNTSSTKPLAVMVWIYGGGFFEGDISDEIYSPDYLINEDVIVVKIAYRLNLFGFLTTGDLNYPGNNGLKDQILGLKWVKENINAFGGDSERITIFGESAGGASVSYLTQTPLTKGLYSRAIMQSGTSLCIWAKSRKSQEVLSNTAKLLEINDTSNINIVNELKSIEYQKLHAASMLASLRIYGNYPIGGLSNAPVIEPKHPNAVITKETFEILESGEFNPTPIMLGFNSMEAVDFQPISEIIKLYLIRSDFDTVGLAPVNLNIQDESIKESVGNAIRNHYFNNLNGTSVIPYLKYISDDYFVRDVIQTANLLSNYTDVFLYQFSYLGAMGNPLRPYNYGTGHTEDLNYLFKRITSPPNPDESDILMRDIIVRLWANFAKYGNPTPTKEKLLQDIIWPKVSKNLDYLDIQSNLKKGTHPHQEDYTFWMDIYNKYGRI